MKRDEGNIFSIFGGLDKFVNIVSDMVENDKDQVKLSGDLGTNSERIKGKYGLNIKLGPGAGSSDGVKDFDKAFDALFEKKAAPKTTEPVTDVFKEEGAVTIVAELPGVDRDDIELSLSDDSVTLSASKNGVTYLKKVMLSFIPDSGTVKENFNNSIYSVSVKARP
jgi:HSP20 family protein